MARLSNSQVNSYQSCPWRYKTERIDGVRSTSLNANLAFGRVVDAVVTNGLGRIHGGDDPVAVANDAGDMFRAGWEKTAKANPIEYTNKAMTFEVLREIGAHAVQAFFPAWVASGLTVATLPDGRPALQLELDADLGDGVGYKSILDVLAFNQEGELGVLDIKTASSASFEEFYLLAPQLTDYQMMVDANAERLGVRPGEVTWLGFAELLKKKTPEVVFSPFGGRRPDEEVAARIADIKATDQAIAAGHFPKRPGMAFNSPCRMCELRNYCLTGDMTGLVRKPAEWVIGAVAAAPRKAA